MANSQIGERCILGQNVFVASGVTLGNGVKVQNNVSLYTGIICEDDVFLGPSAVFTNVINPRSFLERKTEYRLTLLQRGCSVGANATIICGVTLGTYCLIGAGAVVTKNVPDYALVVGNPARQLGWVSRYGHRLQFDAAGLAVCPESGEQYQLTEQVVRPLVKT
jgi:UDP-2-acetamido-3-amino-2,3-dideoxy-glucuronate N-acetyltransferase